jgi:RND family efflux transporter MFP subunit
VQELILPANVEAFYDAPIYARVNGYLKSWAHDIGDRVKAGEVLAVIDAPDLEQQVEQARGDLGLSVAQAGLASITAKRWTALRDQKAVSLQSTDEKTHDLTAKASAAAAAKANLEHLNALKSFLTLVAPFDGVVTARNTDIGALIDAGVGKRDLFRVADIHAMRIYTSVPQAYAAKMTRGLSARLLLPQYPGREFEAKVIANANAITLNSRTLLVQLLADNRDGALWPGAFGQIRFQLPPDGAPLSVPAGALVFLNGKPQVATLDDKSRVRLKTITIARDLGATLEVSTGLTPQDRVIKSPWQSIRDGELVRVMDEKDENGARGAAK